MAANGSVWLITGCSGGLGRALAEAALACGDSVVITARNTEDVHEIGAAFPDQSLMLALDVTKREQIEKIMEATTARFGRLDVLVNNAGRGLFSTIEEANETDIRDLFDVNVFGPRALIAANLPLIRAQKSGHIVNVSSIGGLVTRPCFGIYHATKFAMEGLTETLAQEVSGFGIRVALVEPGPMRTDFNSTMPIGLQRIDEYTELRATAMESVRIHGADSATAAAAIISALNAEPPPLHFVIGKTALESVQDKVGALFSELNAWKTLSVSGS